MNDLSFNYSTIIRPKECKIFILYFIYMLIVWIIACTLHSLLQFINIDREKFSPLLFIGEKIITLAKFQYIEYYIRFDIGSDEEDRFFHPFEDIELHSINGHDLLTSASSNRVIDNHTGNLKVSCRRSLPQYPGESHLRVLRAFNLYSNFLTIDNVLDTVFDNDNNERIQYLDIEDPKDSSKNFSTFIMKPVNFLDHSF